MFEFRLAIFIQSPLKVTRKRTFCIKRVLVTDNKNKKSGYLKLSYRTVKIRSSTATHLNAASTKLSPQHSPQLFHCHWPARVAACVGQ